MGGEDEQGCWSSFLHIQAKDSCMFMALIWFVTASNLVRKANISGMMWHKAVPHPCLSLGVLN